MSTEIAAKGNALRWFGHVLREENNPVRMTLNFEMSRKRKIMSPKEHMKGKNIWQKARLNEEVSFKRTKSRNGIIQATFADSIRPEKN